MQRQVIQSFQGQTQTTSKLQMLFLRRPVIADQVIWIHQAIQDSVRRLKSLHTRRRRYTVLDVTSAAFFYVFWNRLDNKSLFSAERINSGTDGWCELRTSLCSDFLFPFSIVALWFSRRSSHSLTRLKQENHAVGRRLWTRLWTRVWLILGAMLIISLHWNSKLSGNFIMKHLFWVFISVCIRWHIRWYWSVIGRYQPMVLYRSEYLQWM